ncbi:MAG: hypothetical protein WC378_15400, partial [Opitutaceae bacterium]
FFALQQRIVDLLAADPYFTGLDATKQLLTEQVGDLEYVVENALLPLGFGVVITTAAGKPIENDYEALLMLEDLNVSITHNPTLDTAHDALDALCAASKALQGKCVYAVPGLGAPRPYDFFKVTGHQRRFDGPPSCHVHELHVTAGLRLQ